MVMSDHRTQRTHLSGLGILYFLQYTSPTLVFVQRSTHRPMSQSNRQTQGLVGPKPQIRRNRNRDSCSDYLSPSRSCSPPPCRTCKRVPVVFWCEGCECALSHPTTSVVSHQIIASQRSPLKSFLEASCVGAVSQPAHEQARGVMQLALLLSFLPLLAPLLLLLLPLLCQLLGRRGTRGCFDLWFLDALGAIPGGFVGVRVPVIHPHGGGGRAGLVLCVGIGRRRRCLDRDPQLGDNSLRSHFVLLCCFGYH